MPYEESHTPEPIRRTYTLGDDFAGDLIIGAIFGALFVCMVWVILHVVLHLSLHASPSVPIALFGVALVPLSAHAIGCLFGTYWPALPRLSGLILGIATAAIVI